MSPDRPRPWLVFADDWGRHPSSCQHLLRRELGHREVIWVNTIGTRPPRWDWSTAVRAAGKIRGWLTPQCSDTADPSQLSPRILSPKMWPSFRSSFGRNLNRRLLTRALDPVTSGMAEPPAIVTTLPLMADLVGGISAARWIYYCVDDFTTWPGYDGETMLRMERELVDKVDDIIVVSETLRDRITALGRSSRLLTHGVDLDHWRVSDITQSPDEFAGLENPIILFWGVIDQRMDIDFVRMLGSRMDRGSIVLLGPQEDPDPALFSLGRVSVRPPVAFDRLPFLAASATVLVMPYADLPATRAMQPLKLKEYLATGKPAVVRSLPSTESWSDAADLAETPAEFAALVLERVAIGLPPEQSVARGRLDQEGWDTKARQFAEWVDAVNPR